jgi:hypothetical protein
MFVEQTDDQVRITTDRVTLSVPLRPSGDWMASFSVYERTGGMRLLGHSTSLGPPFVPSVFAAGRWTARVERSIGGVTAVLATTPAALPGLAFERHLRLSPSGLIRVVYRAINAGSAARSLQVNAATNVSLSRASGTKVAAPLASGLVVEDSRRFPDWQEPEQGRPERYAEQWMAEFGDGWVGATLWQGAKEVFANWSSPDLVFDLGAIPPGGQAETPPVYLYAGQGDWRTARGLWRQLLNPEAPETDPVPRPAHRLRLERFVFATDEAETRLLLESERSRALSGTASVEVGGAPVARGEVSELRLGEPRSLPLRFPLPDRATAVPATLVFAQAQETERYETAVMRAGLAGAPVAVTAAPDDHREGAERAERVVVQNGRLRFAVAPTTLARMVELSLPDGHGGWTNQLYATYPGPGTFVWFNPWFGGVHPVLSLGGSRDDQGRLREETFSWEPAEVAGAQGIPWRGLTATADLQARGQAGLRLAVSYLTTGQSNVVAAVLRLENRSPARVTGRLALSTFVQPGGDRTKATLYYEREGVLRHRRRVHGGEWGSVADWCAVVAPAGPALALVQGAPDGTIELRDMGLEGAHPESGVPFDLAPGAAAAGVTYLVVAGDLEEARRYRLLAATGDLV